MDREKIAAHARGQNMRTQALQKQSAARDLSGKQIAIEHKIERLEKALSSLSKDLNHANTWKNELLKLREPVDFMEVVGIRQMTMLIKQ